MNELRYIPSADPEGGGGGGNRRTPPPPPLKSDQLFFPQYFFFIRMLKNKAQIARESIKTTL